MSDHRRVERSQDIDLLAGQEADETPADRAHMRRTAASRSRPSCAVMTMMAPAAAWAGPQTAIRALHR